MGDALGWVKNNLSLSNIIVVIVNIVVVTFFIATNSTQTATLIDLSKGMNIRLDAIQLQVNAQAIDINTVQTTIDSNLRSRDTNTVELKDILEEILKNQKAGG